MNLAYALKIVAKQYNKKTDPVILKQAEELVKRETALVNCHICDFIKIPKHHRDNGIPCLNCISNKYR